MPEFTIPAVLQDLEGEPYHLQPYPNEFDSANRDESFDRLVADLTQQNKLLACGVYPDDVLEEEEEEEEEEVEDGDEIGRVLDPWLDHKRMQSLYTLVRKSPSLSKETRENLMQALADSLLCVC